jgi:hypothetical protein
MAGARSLLDELEEEDDDEDDEDDEEDELEDDELDEELELEPEGGGRKISYRIYPALVVSAVVQRDWALT